jgi:hypothetical protein
VYSYDNEIQESVRYLGSDKALECVKADAYWPKWDSPWWHMLLLYEMGLVKHVPEKIVGQYIATLNQIPLKIFPILPSDMPEGIDPYRGSPCHCQLGNVYQVLAAWGVDVDAELPWIRPWFLRYQMADGGLNCDNDAYLVKDEVPSSMVGTIAAFEAVLLYTPRSWTSEEKAFIDKGAQFLMERQLMLGSQTIYNAAELISAKKWILPSFPRFYLYDSLRGLSALIHWANKTNYTLPPQSIRAVATFYDERYPNGQVINERHSYDGVGTILQSPTGEWIRRQPATLFPLLERVSTLGEESPFLSRQWADANSFFSSNKIDFKKI